MDEDIQNSKNKDQNGSYPPNYFIIIAATEVIEDWWNHAKLYKILKIPRPK